MIQPGTRTRGAAQRFALFLIVLLVLTPLVSPARAVQAAEQVQPRVQSSGPGRFESAACMFQVPMGWQQGKEIECGWLIVPEQYAEPNGPTIQLAVAIIKSRAAAPKPDPVVFLQGGPGGSTIDTYSQLIPLNPRLSQLDRDIVLFDQRGTLYSKPALTCKEYDEMVLRTLDENLTREQSNQEQQAAMKACHDRLVKEGVNLSAFDSLENAADVDALRQALGYQQINLYGVSYGTLLALHTLRAYPQGLRSMILDSVVPPQTNFIVDAPHSENRALEAVFTTCAQQTECNQAYPNLKEVFYQQVERLNAKSVQITLTDTKGGKSYPALLDGDSLISAVVQMLYVTDLVPQIPRVIYDVKAGDYSLIEYILGLVKFDRSMSYGMYFSVLCAEDAKFDPNQVNLSDLPKPLADSEQNSAAEFLQTCAAWQVQPLGSEANQAVSSSVPTLVLTGAFDPITPPAYAQAAAKTLPNSYYVEFPLGGHGEVTSGECQDQIFIQFLDNPSQKPVTTCAVEQKMVFSTPGALVRLPKLINLLNVQGTTGIEAGAYALGLLFLLTALLVYPINWLVGVVRGRPKPVVAPVTVEQGTTPLTTYPYAAPNPPTPPVEPPRPRPLLYRLAPWLSALAGPALLVFIVVVTVVAFNMALKNDGRILVGLPGNTRPLFLLPLLALVLAVSMLLAAITGWTRRVGSVWGRLYLSLLTAAAWACIIVLALWGMLFAIFKG